MGPALNHSELIKGTTYKGEIVSEKDPEQSFFRCMVIDYDDSDIFVYLDDISIYQTLPGIEKVKTLTCQDIIEGNYPENPPFDEDYIVHYYKEGDKIMNYYVGEIRLYKDDKN